jgi:hypothetical protein
MQYVNTSPDLTGLAQVIGNLGTTFQQSRQADSDRALEMYRIQQQANQQTASNMLNYLQELRQNRLQESQQAMQMLRLSTEMKETNYQMEQARKLDDAKWQAREARSQLFPLLSQVEGRTQDNDLWGASQLIKQAFSIPGVTDDEVSIKMLTEYNTRLNQFQIDGRPALQVLNGLKSEAMANLGSGSWDKLRDAMKRVSAGSNLDDVSKQFVAEMGAPAGQFAKVKSFLEKGSRITTPEDSARLKQMEEQLENAFFARMSESMNDPMFDADEAMEQMLESKERMRQMTMYGKYSPFTSSDHPTTDYQTINNLIKPVQRNLADTRNIIQTIRENAATRAAFLGGKRIDDQDAIRSLQKKNPQAFIAFQKLLGQRNPKLMDAIDGKKLSELEKPSQLRSLFVNEEGIVRKLEADLGAVSANLLGIMSKIETDPKATRMQDLQMLQMYAEQLDGLLEPFYGAGSVGFDLMNPYASKQILRYARENERKQQRFSRTVGSYMPAALIPSTPAAGGGTTTALPWEGNQ